MNGNALLELQTLERQLRNTLEMVHTFSKKFKKDRDELQLDVRLAMLEDCMSKFYEVRRKIEMLTEVVDLDLSAAEKEQKHEAMVAENAETVWEFENKFCKTKATLLHLKSQLKPTSSDTPVPAVPSTSRVKLPDIKLPTFGGKLMQWITFRDTFRSLIHNNTSLSEIDKFSYLRTSLTGEALQEIGSIEMTAANYRIAWSTLEKRYENNKLILKTHLDAIFAVEPIRKECFEALNHVISTFDKNLQMIDKLGVDTKNWSVLMAHILSLKLDSATLRIWETHYNSKEFVRYETLVTFLRDHCAVLQSIMPAKSSPVERHQNKYVSSHAVSSETNSCYFCDGSQHSVFQCPVMRRMSGADRIAAARRNMLCFNCLLPGHVIGKCTRGFCTICKRKHHTLLHESFASSNRIFSQNSANVPHTQTRFRQANQQTQPPQSKPQTQNPNRYPPTQSTQNTTQQQTPSTSNSSQPTTDNNVTCNSVTLKTNIEDISKEVLLSTAIVRVHDQFGHMLLARALLDSASQRNLVTTEFAQKLKCKTITDYLKIKGVGSAETTSTNAVVVSVSSRSSNISRSSFPMKFHILARVTSCLPCKYVSTQHLEWPENINLADPHFNVPGPIDMIIGAEHFYELLLDGRRKLGQSEAVIQNSTFGWIVSGVVDISSSSLPRVVSNVGAIHADSTMCIQDQLAKFWELESCHLKSMLSIEESACEEFFKKTTYRDESGKFVVSLPKKPEVICKLGESRSIAVKQFLGLEKRLEANPQVKLMYTEFIHEYLFMGHMEKVPDHEVNPSAYFLPHHAVIKPESLTTQLRVVFNASCLTSTGISLNDALMVGPVVQDDLYDINIRFRLHMFAAVADVAKMYRMAKMNPADQHLQMIVWRDEPNEPIQSFKLTTVTYGTASAPYLATKCLQALADEGKSTHPIGSRVVRKDFYVDDMLSGADTLEAAKQLVSETCDLMSSAGFLLRKWKSNHPEVLQGVPASLRDDETTKQLDAAGGIVKTLGMQWDSRDDCYRFNVPKWSEGSAITKRMVLSDTARIFDPLGIVGPIVVVAKIFLQDLWKEQVDWDEHLAEELQNRWLEYRRNMLSLESISVPRWVGSNVKCIEVELHGFADASDKAYGACLYIRSVWDDGTTTVNLLTSKSKVAPLEDLKRKKKKQSTPRLELSAALLMSHMYEKVKKNLPLATKPHFWTDSMIVKCWLASSPSRWQPFVANRVSEIQHLTDGAVWNHVPGIENPADIISRGMIPAQLQYSSLWWNGPLWLQHDRTNWPQANDESSEDLTAALQEQKATVSCPVQVTPPNEIFTTWSSLCTLTRIVAFVRRFAYNCKPANKNNRKCGSITYAEYDEALMSLVKLSQLECFPEEIKELSRGNQVKESSRINSLKPILVDGVMFVGGRLRNAAISARRKHPAILDHRHPLTKLILRDYHHKYLHAGQQLLISCVRERFWPLNIGSAARQLIHSCVPCFRAKPKILDQLMGDLPQDRVTPAPAFLKVGVDYCGPFLMSYPGRKARPVKCFVAVFVCLVTKAVHLEVVADLTSQAFVAALRRFVARRSKPQLIMCDNAKNFVGARREIDELANLFRNQQFQQSVVRKAMTESTEFKFIPARSPNFGGLWEAAVKSFKSHLKKTIGIRILSHDEFVTMMVQVEACLNSRPLTPLSSDPNDLEVLTPGHFLVQRPLIGIPEPSYEDIPENRLSMWQRSQEFVRQIWKKWSTQYLSTLQSRTKWTRQRDNLAVGTMVLLKEDNLPPLKWQLGRVTEVSFGKDGNVRVAVIRTKDGVYERGISKICILPIKDNQPTSQEEN